MLRDVLYRGLRECTRRKDTSAAVVLLRHGMAMGPAIYNFTTPEALSLTLLSSSLKLLKTMKDTSTKHVHACNAVQTLTGRDVLDERGHDRSGRCGNPHFLFKLAWVCTAL